ncbi:ComEC/Rec2 family competence protein [Pseudothermotoga sp. U03pept]|uniref:ComEC/Rec2 family competence protein n=1 Tax=Pseudothermotoga sp. U03pept TaxID=3447012 RepID=UPI003F03D271
MFTPVFLVVIFFLPFLFLKGTHFKIYGFCVILGALLGTATIENKQVELVGLVSIKKSNYVIITNVRVLTKDGWRSSNHQVRVNSKELKAGQQVYIFGRLSKAFRYPVYTVEPIFCAGVEQTLSGFTKVLSLLQEMKEANKQFTVQTLGSTGKIMNGLLFSDGEFDAADSEQLRNSGLAHLFAVSGLHVGIIYTFCELLVSFFTYRFFFRRSISTLIALLFALSTGPTPSAFRASIMLIIWNFFKIVDYPIEPLNVIGLVGTINLLLEPYSILSPSFLMSYSATTSILIFHERIKTKKTLLQGLLVSSAAFMGVAPFLSLFSTINLLAPLTSIPATFLVIPTLWAGFVSILFRGMGFEKLGQVALIGATPFIFILNKMIELTANLPTLSLGLFGYALFSALMLFLFWHFGHKP